MNDQTSQLSAKLFNKIPEEMSNQELDWLIDQYKLYVEMMDRVSERRHRANSFFLTVNTLLITALTGFVSLTQRPNIQYGWITVASVAGVVFCLTWRRLILSYKQLNTGKFKVIHLLELQLPARLYDVEWDALNHGDGTVYRPFSHTEMVVPLVFAFLYGVLATLPIWELIQIP